MLTNRLSINELWYCQNEQVWSSALANYWNFVKPHLESIERQMDSLNVVIVQNMNQQQWYEFLLNEYFRWKYTAANRYASTSKHLKKYIEEDKLPELYRIKQELFSFNRSDIYQGLKIAYRIKGLGTSGASGLLSILFPKYFGTVDQFAVKALQDIENLADEREIRIISPEGIKISEGIVLVAIMRSKADELNQHFQTNYWTPRKVDMVLWTYGR